MFRRSQSQEIPSVIFIMASSLAMVQTLLVSAGGRVAPNLSQMKACSAEAGPSVRESTRGIRSVSNLTDLHPMPAGFFITEQDRE